MKNVTIIWREEDKDEINSILWNIEIMQNVLKMQ